MNRQTERPSSRGDPLLRKRSPKNWSCFSLICIFRPGGEGEGGEGEGEGEEGYREGEGDGEGDGEGGESGWSYSRWRIFAEEGVQ